MDNLKFSQCSMKLLFLPVPQSDFVGVEYLLFTYFYLKRLLILNFNTNNELFDFGDVLINLSSPSYKYETKLVEMWVHE